MVKIKEIMKRYVFTIEPDASASDASKIMTENRVGSLVIMEKEKPKGIVTDSHIVTTVAKGMNPKKVKVRDLPQHRFVTASPDDNMLSVMNKMIKSGVKRVPIVNRGKLVGIVSDKELLIASPQMIKILSEKLKARVAEVTQPEELISGLCEGCESYSDELENVNGEWLCEDCRD